MVYRMRIKVGEAEPLNLRYQEEPGNEKKEEILISKLAAFVPLSCQWMLAESLYCRSQNRAIPPS